MGKFSILEIAAKGLINSRPPKWKRFWQRFRSHESKSAQLEAQLQWLAIASGDAEDFGGLAHAIFSPGLKTRNSALYVDLAPDGNLRGPSDINFDLPLPGIRALATRALAPTDQRGKTRSEIETYLRVEPNDDARRTAAELLTRTLTRARDAGTTQDKVIDLINKVWR